MSDEEIIKRKLLLDGDGTGDDRRLNVMLKMITKWINTDYESNKEFQMDYDKILLQLHLCEHSRRKSQLIRKRNLIQIQQYKDFHNNMTEEISKIKTSINISKSTFKRAKIFKQNKMKYDMLAKDILEQPSREETSNKLMQLESEIFLLKDESKRLAEHLDSYKRQIHIIATSGIQIRNDLEFENKKEAE